MLHDSSNPKESVKTPIAPTTRQDSESSGEGEAKWTPEVECHHGEARYRIIRRRDSGRYTTGRCQNKADRREVDNRQHFLLAIEQNITQTKET
jgi:hypothetical protein